MGAILDEITDHHKLNYAWPWTQGQLPHDKEVQGNVVDGGIRTAFLCRLKRPLGQLCHNNCPAKRTSVQGL